MLDKLNKNTVHSPEQKQQILCVLQYLQIIFKKLPSILNQKISLTRVDKYI